MFFLNLQRCGVMRKRADPTADYFWIFPNWMLNCYPDNISVNIVLPLARERPVAIVEWYLEEQHGNSAARASVEFGDQIQREDVGISKGCKESAIAELLAGTLQREAGKRGTRVSPDVRGMDERQLVEL